MNGLVVSGPGQLQPGYHLPGGRAVRERSWLMLVLKSEGNSEGRRLSSLGRLVALDPGAGLGKGFLKGRMGKGGAISVDSTPSFAG